MGGEQFVQGGAGLVEEGAARREVGLLPQKRDAGAGVQADLAGVGPVEAGEDAHERGLADAVGPDEADALAGVQLEAEVLEQRPRVEAARQLGATQQQHEGYCKRIAAKRASGVGAGGHAATVEECNGPHLPRPPP